MADPIIRIKRSAVEGKIPTPDQLPVGEIALNTYDGKLFASKNVGIGTTVVVVNPWSVGTGTDTYNTYFTVGNVGIGSTLPTSTLDIIGDINASGIITATGGFNLGISSEGTLITSGPVTTLNFLGTGNTFAVNGTTVDINVVGAAITQTPARTVTSYVATSGISTYSVTYQVGYLDVFLNGSRLNSDEFAATDGTSVILSEGPSEGDILDFIYYSLGIGATGPQGPSGVEYWTSTTAGIHTLSNVGIGTTNPITTLDVGGTINSSTDVQIGGVSILTTAQNDAVALAIALG